MTINKQNNIVVKLRIKQYLVFSIMLLLSNFWFNNAYAIGYMLHNDSLLELQIAKDAPTRINIEGEKINDIFIYPKEAAEVVVHDSGCLFILPQVGNSKVYLTLIGENGTVQDVILRFASKSPSPVRLIKYDLNQDLTNIKEEKDVHKQASKTK
ncbi:hypothetical protein [Candidatus Tisiphia endosymbiont of Dioctria rufipes]|uniref:hypothetical protein n=1 Tax=unclassified Candidatus Tisiphia TaxID=2996318 RepID=UPI00397750EE